MKPAKLQADKFRDLARELECDEDESAFDRKLERVAKPPPSDQQKPKKGKPAK